MSSSGPIRPLNYALPPERYSRPRWVYAVVATYLLLLLCFISLPGLAALLKSHIGADNEGLAVLAGCVAVFSVSGGLLILIPVRLRRSKSIPKRAIWLPLIGASILFAILCFGAGLATIELLHPGRDDDVLMREVYPAVGALWIVWMVLFWVVSRSLSPLSFSARTYKVLIAGSVVELLVAVPMHLVVRRRTECCAGFSTGLAICLGAATALVAFGPGMFFLYHRRWKQAYGERLSHRPTESILP